MQVGSTVQCGALSALVAALIVFAGGCANVAAPSGAFVPGRSVDAETGAAKQRVVPCSRLQSLRKLHADLNYAKNPSTGDTLEYLVLGDAAVSGDLILMFPGTGQIVPDWPVQMISNSTYSPSIVKSDGYKKSENGNVSLCHDYRMVFFDYPGVGRTPYAANATRDAVANDVDFMLSDIGTKFGIPSDTVDPLGWSLGTTFALKYAFLSPAARPSRKIHNVLLIAGNPGGSEQGQVGSDSASCVSTLFDASLTATGTLDRDIKGHLSKLIFPYEGQGPKDSGTRSRCTATIANQQITMSVSLKCTILNSCKSFLDIDLLSSATYPWIITRGIDQKVYVQQREEANDWDVDYCATAGPNFTSKNCTSYGTVQQSITNGGACKTDTSNPDKPVTSDCVSLKIAGKVVLLDGYEDLLDQWTYDKALADGLNHARPGIASYAIYPGLSGHGTLVQHPKWTQARLAQAMQTK
jgi:hypothetical protein